MLSSSSSNHHTSGGDRETKPAPRRNVKNVVTDADYAELDRHYRFVLDEKKNENENDDNDNKIVTANDSKQKPRKKNFHDDDNDDDDDHHHHHHVDSSSQRLPASSSTRPRQSTTWQERMVQRYHEHLYKDYVLADLTRVQRGQIGLRWRTAQEVQSGKGSTSCGNKHCVSHTKTTTTTTTTNQKKDTMVERGNVRNVMKQQSTDRKNDADGESILVVRQYQNQQPRSEEDEVQLLQSLPPGALQTDFEVPFSYSEQGKAKTELVKLRLCARCAPLLFVLRHQMDEGDRSLDDKNGHPALSARRAREQENPLEEDDDDDDDTAAAATATTTTRSIEYKMKGTSSHGCREKPRKKRKRHDRRKQSNHS